MRTATGTTVIRNGQLIDGTGKPPVRDAAVVVQDGRIAYAGPVAGAPPLPPDAARIDARGGTILPGLVEAHYHPTYFNVAALEDLDIKYPVEYVTLLAAANAKLALECGYTAARSGGSLFNIDVWLKKAIENDLRAQAGGQRAGDLRRWRADGLEPSTTARSAWRGWCCWSTALSRPAPRCASWSRTASSGSRPTPPATPPPRTRTTTTRCA
ncbi:MAG: hypothetical protein U0797_14855 [Gemmataceae bacterium]